MEKKYVKQKFFTENQTGKKDWLKEFVMDALNEIPEEHTNMKEMLEKLSDKFHIILERNSENFDTELWYSNDIIINKIMHAFINNADEVSKEELKKVYIGKLKSDDINAEAHYKDSEYKGYLITYNFELEYISANFSELLVSYFLFITNRSDELKDIIILLVVSILNALPNQSEEVIYISSSKEFSELKPIYSKMFMDSLIGAKAFVVAHEIGHHFLKHTDLKKTFMQPYIRAEGNKEHADEFAADEFAINLMFTRKNKSEQDENDPVLVDLESLGYYFGPMIVFISLAYNDSEPWVDSKTHPSIQERYLKVIKQMKDYSEDNQYEFLLEFTTELFEIINKKKLLWENSTWWDVK